VALRAERARLLGYPTFAHYRLDDAMAKTPEAVRSLLERVWLPARSRAMEDAAALQGLVQDEGKNFALAPWDWRYYSEKLRKVRCDSTRPRSSRTSSSTASSRRRSTPRTACSA
jgi:peptidyl-dipeptidase Dcp